MPKFVYLLVRSHTVYTYVLAYLLGHARPAHAAQFLVIISPINIRWLRCRLVEHACRLQYRNLKVAGVRVTRRQPAQYSWARLCDTCTISHAQCKVLIWGHAKILPWQPAIVLYLCCRGWVSPCSRGTGRLSVSRPGWLSGKQRVWNFSLGCFCVYPTDMLVAPKTNEKGPLIYLGICRSPQVNATILQSCRQKTVSFFMFKCKKKIAINSQQMKKWTF